MRFLFGSSKIPVGVTLVAVFLAILATVAAYTAFHSFTSDGDMIYIKDASPAVVSQFEDMLDKLQIQGIPVEGWETWPAKKKGDGYVVLMPFADGITQITVSEEGGQGPAREMKFTKEGLFVPDFSVFE